MNEAGRGRMSRGGFIAGAAGVGGAVAVGGVAGAQLLSGQSPPASADADALAPALALERLQAAFYAQAIGGGALSGELLDFATAARDHDEGHAALLASAAGVGEQDPATYDFGAAVSDPEAFAATAVTIEDLAVSAYNGLMASLSAEGLSLASRIVSVDARHAAWIRAIIGRQPAAQATDTALSPALVTARYEGLGVVERRP